MKMQTQHRAIATAPKVHTYQDTFPMNPGVLFVCNGAYYLRLDDKGGKDL